MPTDDDHGRRERLLLHQHPSAQYGPPSSPISLAGGASNTQINSTNALSSDCFKQSGQASSSISVSSASTTSASANGGQEQRFQTESHQYATSLSATLPPSSLPSSGRSLLNSGQSQSILSERYTSRYSESGNSLLNERFQQQIINVSNSSDYSNTASLLVSSVTNNPFSSETFPSPPSPAPTDDRFVPPPPLSPSPSEKYASSQSLSCYNGNNCDRIPQNSPAKTSARDRFGTAPTSPMPSLSTAPSTKDVSRDRYQTGSSSTERLLSGSPVLGSLQGERAIGSNRYAISSERLLSSSPINAPVPERFAGKANNDRYLNESPIHERFERYLSISPNPEGVRQRYSSTERVLVPTNTSSSSTNAIEQARRYSTATSDRSIDAISQKYAEQRSSPSPASVEFNSRFPSYPETSTQSRYIAISDRFNDVSPLQRFNQSRGNERYLTSVSPAHDTRQSNERYASSASSTERLLASSSSPSSSETNRYRVSYNSNVQSSTTDRFLSSSSSPTTPDNQSALRSYPNATGAKSGDKYLQLCKSVQSYHQCNDARYQSEPFESTTPERYTVDRYTSTSNANTIDRYHNSTERYSPARASTSDKYLSLPKPKDRYTTGRVNITNGSQTNNDRLTAYGSTTNAGSYVPPTAHTPVERYVPQPPPEVLYPDRYVDRYATSSLHTPTDRYIPVNDPGDPYMRRDLGFHHHYRLPPPGYPTYHQTHYRFRAGFPSYAAAASPNRLSGSPGSSSSSSSTSVQRDGFSTSPLLRSKTRASNIDYTNSNNTRQSCANNSVCCNVADNNANGQQQQQKQRACCQPIRRSLPPGALPAIPTQSSHSSWQPSPSSGTTGTSTVSTSSGPDGESNPSINLYPVGAVEMNTVSTETSTSSPTTTTSPSVPLTTGARDVIGSIAGSTTNITRSMSAPPTTSNDEQKPAETTRRYSSGNATNSKRPRLRRPLTRSAVIRKYLRRETTAFFGVNENSEPRGNQNWLDNRRRMAFRKFGVLFAEHRPPDVTKDVPDTTDLPEGLTLRRWQRPVRRKPSVARMTLTGLNYMMEFLMRKRRRNRKRSRPLSRSFIPCELHMSCEATGGRKSTSTSVQDIELEEKTAFFDKPLPSQVPPGPKTPDGFQHQQVPVELTHVSKAEDELDIQVQDTSLGSAGEQNLPDGLLASAARRMDSRLGPQKDERTTAVDGDTKRTTRNKAYVTRSQQDGDDEIKPDPQPATGTMTFGRRISPSLIARVFDNSNRRIYGTGLVERYFGWFRKRVATKPDIRRMDHIDDHRCFFTYWVTTVQILAMIVSLATYGFAPFGFGLKQRSGLVLVTSLSLQQVDYQEPANFWLGPRAADLIRFGAKYAPCMRRDIKILKQIDVWRERERDTACCIRNDDSGCVQSSKADCSNIISTWKKWSPGDSGPGGRISGSVCGLDPKFCDAPASIAPYEWPDDITKWPICRKTNAFSQRFSSNDGTSNQGGSGNFPIGRYKDKMAEHMVCEVIGHPCCIGIHGMCRITTKEYCDFVNGHFHEEASLCSQVECLHDVCTMIPFLNPEWPDQFYRLFTGIFIHAGIFHLAITLWIQYFFMRDLEKLAGSLRIGIIYFTGGLGGNLASAIFVPYTAEVGPAGAHLAIMATYIVELMNCWYMLENPKRALMKFVTIILVLFLLGFLPWVDNYANLFGFIFGFLATYAFMPYISIGRYHRKRKILLIWFCLMLIVGLFGLLLALFYNMPEYECEMCKLFTCIPFTRDFCASQNINLLREEPV